MKFCLKWRNNVFNHSYGECMYEFELMVLSFIHEIEIDVKDVRFNGTRCYINGEMVEIVPYKWIKPVSIHEYIRGRHRLYDKELDACKIAAIMYYEKKKYGLVPRAGGKLFGTENDAYAGAPVPFASWNDAFNVK